MAVARHILLHARKIGGGGAAPPVPLGAIAMWSGTLASIPANWSLCDGTGGTPNLIARFLRGAPAATEPGTTGGADSHTHASMTAAGGHSHTLQISTHQHQVSAAGGHNHAVVATAGFPGPYETIMCATSGAHQHTVNWDAGHTHSTDATINHTHGLSSDDGRPPYYEVAFIRAGVGALVAANIVIIWTGTLATIPMGWSLCDGGGGRPDLRTRFLRGVNTNVTNPGTTGGNATHGHTEVAQAAHSHTSAVGGSHTHSFNAYTWTHSHNVPLEGGVDVTIYQTDTGAGNHTHANSDDPGNNHNHNPMGDDGGHSHVVDAASSLPAYYDVAYIINDGGATTIPPNGVLIWTDLLANIPGGYNLCDGGGGRPELHSRFIRGSNAGVDPGGTGGSDTHTHTDQNAGAHSGHSQISAGAHQHAATNNIGSHTHTTGNHNFYAPFGDMSPSSNQADGAHFHTYNNEGNHTHTLSDPGNHNHNPWSTDDGRPAYYEVAFIQKA